MRKYYLRDSDITESSVAILLNRIDDNNQDVVSTVKQIIEDVKVRGDYALRDYTEKFDNVSLSDFKVTESEIKSAYNQMDSDFIDVLLEAKKNITEFHKHQIQNTWTKEFSPGVVLGQKVTPIPRVGLYVPGGKGGYPSTVLMDAIPALVAGVNSIALITPPAADGSINPYILAAAYIAGISEIYKVGGAQGIAALAYGTDSIKAVNKIVGPGNVYVATAKKLVFGKVDIDMIAGPSEICIIADKSSNASFIASDMLSQAEHDEMATSILISTDESLVERVTKQLQSQMQSLSRKDLISKSLESNALLCIVDTLENAIDLSNLIAPEHLEIMVEKPFDQLDKIINAGAIFLGNYSPEPVGDYFAGPNHTLPTSGTAKFSSPLGVYDFVKKSSIISYQKESLEIIKDKVMHFAEIEGFDAHANAIRRRFNHES
ncbi:histidinol dehydrogenase [Alkalibaculum sp. M08DMB]|uniref:Histidinol dehydrogenase n=1 Tax=Alkalibaculum sporogenes TaxID=2655001 RepID=A0A6A7K795_9FIRM|nr:histidinol dehydrogenase [Alkalibaculum sporogenes]MPW25358.1 histidinol dehydrogenase [Alkalibaculum sporogenes]